ncbi:metal-sensitive transcriptional regulator [Streptomyces sp. SCSIO 30461]|uniref:metal-sensitive transcriptional regulator n=1 Tax=Streptomyces sp. SCSIO 30461 TaxID=3118085 RepID=UPI0030CF62F0
MTTTDTASGPTSASNAHSHTDAGAKTASDRPPASDPASDDTAQPTAAHTPATIHEHGVHGYHEQKDEHLKRLRRIEGQVRGLQRMVAEDTYCIDILTQVSASTKALQSFALQLLEEHLRHCVADAALKGGDEIDAKVEEATKAIARMMRT